ncbi:MAG: hypothetical protein ACQEP1_04970 [Nanobdellota archaeon]
MKKRGGISLYIILGVALLMIAVVLTFPDKSKYDFSKDLAPETNHPVVSYVDQCIKDTTVEGIKEIGAHGGYLQPSDGLRMGSTLIPYWYYFEDGAFGSDRPPLCQLGRGCESEGSGSVEEQLNLYLQENLDSCINDFESFEDQYVVEDEDYNTKVMVRDGDVRVNVAYPMEIVSKEHNTVKSMKNFNVKVPVNLKEVYELASKIVKAESEGQFIEEHVMNLISIYSKRDPESLPPRADLSIGGHPDTYWMKPRIRSLLKNEILGMVRLLQVVNTEGFNPIYELDRSTKDQIRQGIYNAMSIQLGEKFYKDTKVDFFYPGKRIELGGPQVVYPEDRLPISNFLTQMMRFTVYDYSYDYDLTFPTVVTIKRDVGGEEINFRFAVEGNIVNSNPLDSDFDLDNLTKPVSLPMFDSPAQRVNDSIEVEAKDAVSGEQVNANVFYECGQRTHVGRTPLDEDFPYCMFGGKLIIEKKDYLTEVINYSNEGQEDSFSVEMYPLKELDLEMRKIGDYDEMVREYNPIEDTYYEYSSSLNDSEKVIFSIRRIKEDEAENNVPMMGFYDFSSGEKDYNEMMKDQLEKQYERGVIDEQQKDTAEVDASDIETDVPDRGTVKLVPGKYKVDVYFLYEENLTIPRMEDTKCPCSEVLGECVCDEEDIVYPETNFTVFPKSQARFNVTIGENIYENEEAVFFVHDKPIPRDWNELMDFNFNNTETFEPVIR